MSFQDALNHHRHEADAAGEPGPICYERHKRAARRERIAARDRAFRSALEWLARSFRSRPGAAAPTALKPSR
jgi:hypothetical protein